MKVKFIYLITITIFISISQYVVAQFDISTQVQRPSIEANKLTENIEVPVNLYTGTVNIEIPIYTIKYNDIVYPIYLSYHGGGIKVSDECGSVGLGWTLNATGVINRIVRGLPDEMNTNGKYGYNHLTTNYKGYIKAIKSHSNKNTEPIIYDNTNFNSVNSMISNYGSDYDEGLFDPAQDNYMFNVHGKNGIFIYNNFQKIIQTNDGCNVIKNNSNQYTIESQDGFKYIFNDIEQKDYKYKKLYIWESNDDTKPEFNYKHNSSWWLSKLYSPTGDSIIFSYDEIKILHPHENTYIYSHIVLTDDYTNNPKTVTNLYTTSSNYKDTTYHQILKEIKTPNCNISFFYNANIQEDEATRIYPRVDSIVVYSRQGEDNICIEKFIFDYSDKTNRAKLISLERIGTLGEKETYYFTYKLYNTTSNIEINDRRIDHWGFFSSQSTGRFDPTPYISAPNFLINLDTTLYKSRQADAAYADNNMLTSILYPTGKLTEFIWEPHTFSSQSYVANTAVNENNIQEEEDEEEIEEVIFLKDLFTLCGKENCSDELSKTQNLTSGDIISIDLTKYYNEAIKNPNLLDCIYNYHNCNFFNYAPPTVVVKRGSTTISEITICKESMLSPIEIEIETNGEYTFTLQNPRNMINDVDETCKGYLDIFNMNSTDVSPDGIVTINHYGKRTIVNSNSNNKNKNIIGGVRIKEICYKENSTILYKKKYQYVLDDKNKTSSGILIYPHRYGSKNIYCDKVNSSGNILGYIINEPELLTLHSKGLPYTLGNNTHIEYSRVIETLYDNKTNKNINQIIYNFATSVDADKSDINMNKTWEGFIPSNMIQLTSKAHQRGHLTSKIEYGNEKITTQYNYRIREKQNNDTITGAFYTIADYKEVGARILGTIPYKNVGIIQYQVIPYNKQIVNITQEGDITNNNVKYYYAGNEYSDALNSNQPIIIETIDSDNSIVRKYMSYLGETDKVVSCITTKNEKVIDAYRYEYDNKKRVIKKYIALLENSSLPTKENCSIQTLAESYVYYNNRLVEKTDHLHNISTTYLWSYNNSYIIAQIQYSTFNEVKNALEESTINSLMNAYIPDMSIVNNLRSQLPDSYVTTLTYRPLIGVSSYTDERGQTVYYDYDGFGRMIESYIIENNQKKVIKHFKYKTTQ